MNKTELTFSEIAVDTIDLVVDNYRSRLCDAAEKLALKEGTSVVLREHIIKVNNMLLESGNLLKKQARSVAKNIRQKETITNNEFDDIGLDSTSLGKRSSTGEGWQDNNLINESSSRSQEFVETTSYQETNDVTA